MSLQVAFLRGRSESRLSINDTPEEQSIFYIERKNSKCGKIPKENFLKNWDLFLVPEKKYLMFSKKIFFQSYWKLLLIMALKKNYQPLQNSQKET